MYRMFLNMFHVQDVSEYVPATTVRLAHCLRYFLHVRYVADDNCSEETGGPFNRCDRVGFIGILQ